MADGPAGAPIDHDDLSAATLEDRYDLRKKRVLMTGTQAVVRLLLMQREADRRAGLNTAGYVTGYRGSPLGGVDAQMHRAKPYLDDAGVLFQPGLNEDLAATAIWGAQQAEMRGEGRYDGVFSLWYGKGPGVDRSGDVLRHVNLAGSSRYGGVLALMGDDHTAESSTTAHQSEFHFVDVDDADPFSRRRAGDTGLRPPWLRDVALRRRLGRAEMRQGHGRIDGVGRCVARARHDRPAAAISPCRPAD